MSVQTNYVKLGAFVLITSVLILAGLIVLGGGKLWSERILVETYLDESAQGLEAGSVVKMRGVQVGNIEQISFVYLKYPEAFQAGHRYVLVEIGLQADKFGDFPRDKFKELLAEEIATGLRIRITPQGLTGAAYLELDYTSPFRAPALPINWTPVAPYIPSAPGTITRFEETFESVSTTLKNLEGVNLNKPLERLEELMNLVMVKVDAVQTEQFSAEAIALMEELRRTNAQVARLLGSPDDPAGQGERMDLQSIFQDVSLAMREVRGMAEEVNKWVHAEQGGLEDLRLAVVDLRRAMADAPEMVEDFSSAADTAQESFLRFQQLLGQIQLRLASKLEQIDVLLHNLGRTSENVREITDDARDYPSRLFFGDPPAGSRNQEEHP
ncbi:MlaD family protein [Desulfonatronum thiodismutans]|uniref:MlaD family protein n=1 Tax=Desulfonatronum thiodismutans TaxID=159290 RepID=UPI0004ABDC3D|nr:MlaD family protein [Desulfonatronum thiodismutans]